MYSATLRLFNAIQVDEKESREIPSQVLERTVKNGYFLSPEIVPNEHMLRVIDEIIGISGEKANASFHKSWRVVRDASIEQLIVQQIIHYITTYGFEALGIYNQDTVYIPLETLELPDVKNIPLTFIKAMTSEEILDKIVELAGSGIALSKESADAVMEIVISNKYTSEFVENVKNRELKSLLYDHYDLVPSDPTEFLRYLISKLTGESLVIKNRYLIEKIKGSNWKQLDKLIQKSPEDLASIFLRYKPLFLAMKSVSHNKTFFNHLRKQANLLHKPLGEDYLNNVTSRIKSDTLGYKTLEHKLADATIWRKIRLAYALKYRLGFDDSIVYRVRNGRGWATDFEWNANLEEGTQEVLSMVLASIAKDICKNVEDRVIYIPSNIHYTLPATEKQFMGNFPNGTYVIVPEDLIVGIHWTNTPRRVDLDLSLVGLSGKYGWDSYYRSSDRGVLFSGDVTDAPKPKGASELFYIRKGEDEPRALMVNYFNHSGEDEVDCKVLVAHENPKGFGNNYMVNVNNLIATANVNISKKQNVLGLVVGVNGENRVYFSNVSIGNSITSSAGTRSEQIRKYYVASLTNSIELKDVFEMAGAIVVNEKPLDIEFLDLSPESLDKTTFINLLKS